MNPDDVYTYTRRTETKKQGKFRTRSIVALSYFFFASGRLGIPARLTLPSNVQLGENAAMAMIRSDRRKPH